MVTMEPVLKPWLPEVVTVTVVPERWIDCTGTVSDEPNEIAAILLLLVEKSLSTWVRSFWQLAVSPSGQYVYTRRGFTVVPLAPSNVAATFCLRSCCATPPFSTTSPSPPRAPSAPVGG